MKSEPAVYSIADLKRDKRTHWEGVRNYQARNFLRDEIKRRDLVFFYHSNAEPSGIAGVAEVVREGYPDASAFDPQSEYFDPKSNPARPSWYVVDLKFVKEFNGVISLDKLRSIKGLEKMPLLQKGQRLSVQPVSEKEWNIIVKLTS